MSENWRKTLLVFFISLSIFSPRKDWLIILFDKLHRAMLCLREKKIFAFKATKTGRNVEFYFDVHGRGASSCLKRPQQFPFGAEALSLWSSHSNCAYRWADPGLGRIVGRAECAPLRRSIHTIGYLRISRLICSGLCHLIRESNCIDLSHCANTYMAAVRLGRISFQPCIYCCWWWKIGHHRTKVCVFQ
jgi:hypothetical protein